MEYMFKDIIFTLSVLHCTNSTKKKKEMNFVFACVDAFFPVNTFSVMAPHFPVFLG